MTLGESIAQEKRVGCKADGRLPQPRGQRQRLLQAFHTTTAAVCLSTLARATPRGWGRVEIKVATHAAARNKQSFFGPFPFLNANSDWLALVIRWIKWMRSDKKRHVQFIDFWHSRLIIFFYKWSSIAICSGCILIGAQHNEATVPSCGYNGYSTHHQTCFESRLLNEMLMSSPRGWGAKWTTVLFSWSRVFPNKNDGRFHIGISNNLRKGR